LNNDTLRTGATIVSESVRSCTPVEKVVPKPCQSFSGVSEQIRIVSDMLLPTPTLATRTHKAAYMVLLPLAGCGGFGLAQTPSPEDLDFLHNLSEYENIRRMLPKR